MKTVKKGIVAFVGLIMCILMLSAGAENDKENSFNLVHWNLLKNMYKLNEYVNANNLTTKELIASPAFVKILTATFTPDSYGALVDKNIIPRIHPDQSLIGKKLTEVPHSAAAAKIIKAAIKSDTCKRGFYIWIDKEEKYMVVCPIIGVTKDGNKLFYAYTMYTRSMPDYYLKTLKNSVQE